MKLEKAIEILYAVLNTAVYDGDPDDSDALKLGIEALGRVRELRSDGKPDKYSILPGETKD